MTKDVTFQALDGYGLHGTVHGDANNAHTAMLVNSGTGIPRGFYRRFCAEAARNGFLVLAYDYRGVGDSALKPLRKSNAVYRDWGQLDLPGAFDYLQGLAPSLPMVTVGHSTGGQQLGLSDRVTQIRAALFVAVSTGYWRGMPLSMRFKTLTLWHAVMPLCKVILGYFPAGRFGFGENLPIGIAQEWGDWCLEPDYLAAYFDETGRRDCRDGRPFGAQHFKDASFPIRSINFEDDPIASRRNVPPLLALYMESDIEVHWNEPRQLGVTAIGHLGFFRKAHQTLWQPQLDWLRQQAHRL